jgi:hypothetical protein
VLEEDLSVLCSLTAHSRHCSLHALEISWVVHDTISSSRLRDVLIFHSRTFSAIESRGGFDISTSLRKNSSGRDDES